MPDPKYFIDPADRGYKWRQAARVIIRAQNDVLMIEDYDPGVPDFGWLVTPGGGVDPGESFRDAAIREVWEETGHVVIEDNLTKPVASRVVIHGYSDEILVQEEQFFLYDVQARFEPTTDGFTEDEQLTLGQFRWISLDNLPDEVLWPDNIAWLATLIPDAPHDLGIVDESSKPLNDAQLAYVREVVNQSQ